nr:hypothetical protein [Candidatus Sigynarchaeota archaeon]
MARRYYLTINIMYLITIPVWLLIAASFTGFDTGLTWSLSGNAISNSLFLFASSAILLIIGFALLRKFMGNKKDSALLLSTYNLLYGSSSFLEGLGNYMDFHPALNQSVENLTFILVSWAVIFFFLFLQDVFTSSFSNEKHLRSHVFFGIMIVLGDVLLILDGLGFGMNIFSYSGYAIFAIALIILCVWQMVAAFKLVKKSSEQKVRVGLVMIGLSGLLYIFVVVAIALKAIVSGIDYIDVIIPILVFTASIVTYMGYVYPSRHPKTKT